MYGPLCSMSPVSAEATRTATEAQSCRDTVDIANNLDQYQRRLLEVGIRCFIGWRATVRPDDLTSLAATAMRISSLDIDCRIVSPYEIHITLVAAAGRCSMQSVNQLENHVSSCEAE